MTLAKLTDGAVEQYPVTLNQLKAEFPNTSFPQNIGSVDLTSFGYANVVSSAQPTYNANTETITEGTPVLANGVWVQTWQKTNLSAEKITEKTAVRAAAARTQRDARLADTDYLALSDSTLTDEMRTYRQALRDVPAQSGFPDNITWPTKP